MRAAAWRVEYLWVERSRGKVPWAVWVCSVERREAERRDAGGLLLDG